MLDALTTCLLPLRRSSAEGRRQATDFEPDNASPVCSTLVARLVVCPRLCVLPLRSLRATLNARHALVTRARGSDLERPPLQTRSSLLYPQVGHVNAPVRPAGGALAPHGRVQ